MQQFYTDPTPPCGGRGHGLCSKRMRRSEERTQLWEDLIIGPSDPTPNTKNKAKTKTKTKTNATWSKHSEVERIGPISKQPKVSNQKLF